MKSETNEMSLEELKAMIDNLMRYHSGPLAKYACRAIDAALRLEAEMEEKVEDALETGRSEGYEDGYADGETDAREEAYDEGFADGRKETTSEELDEALEWCDKYAGGLDTPPAELVTLLRRHGRNV